MALDSEDIKKITELNLNVVRLQEKVSTLENLVKEKITREEFTPVKLIAYGLATAVLSSVMMAVLAKVIIK
ncbi:hypothetical protein ECML606-1_000010 [Escherichia phage ECML-606-1]|nr:hypothetical protein ECML606-1_000010 [Escherichia phage ECML-606-1]